MVALGSVVLAGVSALILPRLLYPPLTTMDLAGVADPKDRLELQNSARITLLQGLGGAFFLVTAFFTWRQLALAQQQFALTQQAQATERFAQAVKRLGSSELGVRVGGVFALERLAHDSAPDRKTVVETLCAFIRGRAPWPRNVERTEVSLSELGYLRSRHPDVQAALTVLGRLPNDFDTSPARALVPLGTSDPTEADTSREVDESSRMELTDTDLRKATLPLANLCGARLTQAQLEADVTIFRGVARQPAGVLLSIL